MKRRVLLIACGVGALCLGGCFGSNALKAPATTFLNSVGGEYLAYVEADANLSDEQKQIRRTHVESFRAAIEEAR